MCGVSKIAAFIGPNLWTFLDFLGFTCFLGPQLVGQREPLPQHHCPSTDPTFPGEANFSMSTILPTTVWAATTTVQTWVSRGSSQRRWFPCPVFRDSGYHTVRHDLWLPSWLSSMAEGSGAQLEGTWELNVTGKTYKWIPLVLFLWWICGSVEDAWRSEQVVLFSVLKLWPRQPPPRTYFPFFLVSLPLFLHSSCSAAAPLQLPKNVLVCTLTQLQRLTLPSTTTAKWKTKQSLKQRQYP